MQFEAVTFNDDAKKRIADAAIFEKKLRIESVIGVDQEICGFEIRQIAVRDLLNLEFTENRLSKGEEPEIDDLLALFLMLSKDRYIFKARYAKKIARLLRDHEEFRECLICYFNAAFNDMPSSRKSENEVKSDIPDSSVSVITLVDSIASNYGWSMNEILDLPLSASLQLLQRILQRTSEKYHPRNGITQQAKALELSKLKENG